MADLLEQLCVQLSGTSTQLFSDEQFYCLSLLLREASVLDLPLAFSVLFVISSLHLTFVDLLPAPSDASLVAVEVLLPALEITIVLLKLFSVMFKFGEGSSSTFCPVWTAFC